MIFKVFCIATVLQLKLFRGIYVGSVTVLTTQYIDLPVVSNYD